MYVIWEHYPYCEVYKRKSVNANVPENICTVIAIDTAEIWNDMWKINNTQEKIVKRGRILGLLIISRKNKQNLSPIETWNTDKSVLYYKC